MVLPSPRSSTPSRRRFGPEMTEQILKNIGHHSRTNRVSQPNRMECETSSFVVYLFIHTFNQSNSIICPFSFLFFLPLSYKTVLFSLNLVLNTKLTHELSGSFQSFQQVQECCFIFCNIIFFPFHVIFWRGQQHELHKPWQCWPVTWSSNHIPRVHKPQQSFCSSAPTLSALSFLLTWSNGNPHFKKEFLTQIGVTIFQASVTKCTVDQLHTWNIYGGESFEWTAFYSDTWMHEWFPNLTGVAGWYSELKEKRLPLFWEMLCSSSKVHTDQWKGNILRSSATIFMPVF